MGFMNMGAQGIKAALITILGIGATTAVLNLSTVEKTVVDGDKLGKIEFQAPREDSTGDALLVSAAIWAEADATFDTTVNTTDLVFALGKSEVASQKARLSADGNLILGTGSNISGGSQPTYNLILPNGTSPDVTTDVTNKVIIGSQDITGDAASFNFWTEVDPTTDATGDATYGLPVTINGTKYYLLLQTY